MNREASRDCFRSYLAVPFVSKGRDLTGWDCYGLYRWVLAERHGIALPSYADAYSSDTDAPGIARAMGAYRPVGWVEVQPGEVREGDGVVLRIAGMPWHCGYVIEPGLMLHARRGVGTCIESYTSRLWEKRLEGTYRCKS